jgi:hypothetical protein
VLVALVPILISLPRRVRRRRFWCAFQRREVEVEFEDNGPPGLRQPVAVRRCSAFDPPTAVACARRCLDVGFRPQWQPALPVDTRRRDDEPPTGRTVVRIHAHRPRSLLVRRACLCHDVAPSRGKE